MPQKNGKIDTRFYFNGLLKDVIYRDATGKEQKGKFTIRNYFAGGYSELRIKKADDGIFDIEITNVNTPYDDGKEKGLEENITTKEASFSVPTSPPSSRNRFFSLQAYLVQARAES